METLVDKRSRLQHIHLCRSDAHGLLLFLDGKNQFAESTEHRYHECLAVVPMLFRRARTVFVGGGGDGLTAARLLPFEGIERIVVCDYDPEVTALARTHEDLVRLNQRSLDDPRVTVVHEDAFRFLERSRDLFDLVLCDFPDATDETLNRLYSREFYRLVAGRLDAEGLVSVQTTASRRGRGVLRNTLATAFEHVSQFQVHYAATPGTRFFTLGARRPLLRRHPVPPWTRFLSDAVVEALFTIPRDESAQADASPGINDVENGLLAREIVLDAYLDRASEVYAYNQTYRVVQVDEDNVCGAHDLPFFLRCCCARQPTIVLLAQRGGETYRGLLDQLGYARRRSRRRMSLTFTSQTLRLLDDTRRRLKGRGLARVEAYLGRTSQRPEIDALLREYFERHHDRYFDAPPDPALLDRERLHLVVRRDDGYASLLMVVVPGRPLLVDVLYGRGGAREHMLGLLACLRFLNRHCGPQLVFDAATANIEGFMTKLGAFSGPTYDVYVPRVQQEAAPPC